MVLSELSASGRFIVSQSTAPFFSMRSVSYCTWVADMGFSGNVLKRNITSRMARASTQKLPALTTAFFRRPVVLRTLGEMTETAFPMRTIGHFLNGATVEGTSGRFGDIFNPATGEVQAKVAFATRAELRKAVEHAKKAFAEWSAVNPQRRARVMFNFKALVEKNMD